MPDYHPYVATGDFDTDGDNDFAVVVVDDSGSWTFLIFNAPFPDDFLPAFVDSSINFQGSGFFFGPPRSQPYRLIIGPFRSHGASVVPKNGTYEIEYGGY